MLTLTDAKSQIVKNSDTFDRFQGSGQNSVKPADTGIERMWVKHRPFQWAGIFAVQPVSVLFHRVHAPDMANGCSGDGSGLRAGAVYVPDCIAPMQS